MSFQSCAWRIGLVVLLFASGISMAVAQQNVDSQQNMTLATPSTVPNANGGNGSNEDIIKRMDLTKYDAEVKDDKSLCAGNEKCLAFIKEIKSFLCAVKACEPNSSNEPSSCFEIPQKDQEEANFIQNKEKFNELICPFLRSSSPSDEFQNFSEQLSAEDQGANEKARAREGLIKFKAYLYALQGSAVSCENYIKKKVGGYGLQWTDTWYTAISGCRILAHEATREQEEKDYLAWIKVSQGVGSCSDIIDNELQKACNAPGVKFPSGQ